MKKIGWGIVGLGNIAHKFAEDLLLISDAQLIAVASSNGERAKLFATKFTAQRYYDSYASLYEDSAVEIVYIASLHPHHMPMAIDAMQKGKAVLCEKPLGLNAKQVKSLIVTAETNKVFLMEALWTRFLPSFEHTMELIQQGAVGKVRYIQASFSFNGLDRPKTSRVFNPEKAGGALLDIGIYPLFLAYQLLGKPKEIKASAIRTEEGVDLQIAFILTYDTSMAVLYASFSHDKDMPATICGELGEIYLPSRWHETTQIQVVKGGHSERKTFDKKGRGYGYEIEETHNCIREGKFQSSKWSWQNSLELVQLMDTIRNQCKIHYPGE